MDIKVGSSEGNIEGLSSNRYITHKKTGEVQNLKQNHLRGQQWL